ncbi:tetratricopeptide repeat protein [Streptomyces sp. SAI-127]|uniref:tetratricopeptide repeat protein n=1 Tax=Streptomyces sp. SAI-127 TaxID=2940543 RepID=UPI00247491B1|nr:tetratricopeptide repeat protein [Streptomyces sp. SAI-127]MDH6493689.1 hypothetical protein [Streptomyces sp. SAI-127]
MSKESAGGGSRRGVRGGQVAVGGDAAGAALGPNARVVNRTTININVRPEMGWPLRVGAVPPLASSFLPRTALRALVETARDPGQDVELGEATEAGRVLAGEGGVGKSQLAVSYYLRSSADLAVWTTAKGGIARLVGDFAETARRLQAPGAEGENEEADARALLEWLRGTERSWLVVIDDVDDLDAVLPGWPHPHPRGCVLATTRRRKALGAGRTRIDVGAFTAAESDRYLHERAPGLPTHPGACAEHECPAAPIGQLLGYLPLALSHAAAYLLNNTDVSPGAYARMLAEPGRALAEVLPADGADGYGQAVHATMLINLSAVEAAEDRPGLARAVLSTLALLDPNGSPPALWTHPVALTALTGPGPSLWQRLRHPTIARNMPAPVPALHGATAAQVRECLRLMHRYSLITYTAPDQAVIRIHALTARAARDITPHEQGYALARRTADALLALWPPVGRDRALEQALQDNTTAVDDNTSPVLYCPDAHPALYQVGDRLGEAGQDAAARDYFHTLAARTSSYLGPDHSSTLRARHSHARWRGEAGDAQGAADTLAELVPHYVRVLGPDHRDTLSTRRNHARWRGETGDAQGAADTYAELVPRYLRVLGPDHPDTLTVRHNLAYWRGEAGDAQGAADTLADLVPHYVQVLGPDHPDTLTTRHSLGRWRGEAGDAQGAADTLADLVPHFLRVLGPDHPDTLSTRRNHARWRGEAGDAQGAADTLADLVPHYVRVLGPDHPDTLSTRRNHARWRGEAGDAQGAADTLADLVPHFLRVLGPDHPRTLSTRHSLGRWRGGGWGCAGRRRYPRRIGAALPASTGPRPPRHAPHCERSRPLAGAGDD